MGSGQNAVFEAMVEDWQERLEKLNAAVQIGLDEIERGEGIRVDNLDAWGETLGLGD